MSEETKNNKRLKLVSLNGFLVILFFVFLVILITSDKQKFDKQIKEDLVSDLENRISAFNSAVSRGEIKSYVGFLAVEDIDLDRTSIKELEQLHETLTKAIEKNSTSTP